MSALQFGSKLEFVHFFQEQGVIDQMVWALLQVYEADVSVTSPTELITAAFGTMANEDLQEQIQVLRTQLRQSHRQRSELLAEIKALFNEINCITRQ